MAQEKDSPYLTGKVLIAMPAMSDPRFQRAVIYLCAHDETGAMGLVINQRLSGLKFGDLVSQLSIGDEEKETLDDLDFPVLGGGPVETARGFLLHSSDFSQKDTVAVDGTFCVTGTVDALKAVATGNGPEEMLFILGYAGWGPGQLDSELQQNAWLTADPDEGLLFRSSPEEKWEAALRKLGIEPSMLSSTAGRA